MKDLSKLLVVKELINSLKLIKTNLLLLVVAAITDATFFIAWGFFTTPVKDKLVEHSILLSNKLSSIVAGKPVGLLNHMLGPELSPMTMKLLMLMGMLFLVMYVVYVIFQGTTWWLATQISGQKLKYRQYMLGFAKINLIWLGGYIIYKIFDIALGIRSIVIQALAPGTPNIAGKILLIALIFLGLAAFLSYPKLKAKTIIKTPWKISAPLILLSASIYLTAQFILNNISKINIDAALIAGILILFPTISLIRVYVTRVITNVHTRT